jgi:hypothetical protein
LIGEFKLPKIPSGLEVGDAGGNVEYTEVRIWAKAVSEEKIKENIRSPLSMVAEKRKRLKMKLK